MPYKNPEDRRACNQLYRETHKTAAAGWSRDARLRNAGLTMYYRTKCRAKRLGIAFDLEPDDIAIPDTCPILGIQLAPRCIGKRGPIHSSPSIDKIVPVLGYTKGNIQVISNKANAMKNDATPAELLAFADWINWTYGTKQ